MKIHIPTFILVTLLLSSCSSTKDVKFRDQVSTELVETFDIQNDEFSKFKVEEIPNVKKVDKVVKVEEKSTKKVTKKSKKSNIPKVKKTTKAKKEVVKEKAEKKEVVSQEQIKSKKQTYPKDYPDNFKKYNKNYKYVWDTVKPYFFPNEKFVLKASYLGVTVGHAKLESLPVVSVAGRKAFHFKGSLKSASFYNYIYTVEDWVESYVDAETFVPVKYTLIQRESGQDVDDLQLFDSETLKTHFWYKKIKKEKLSKKELHEYTPKYFQDSFSALYFVRGLDLSVGSKYEFPIITRAKLWLMNMEVEKIERIKIMGKWQDAYRIKAETRFPGILRKKGDILFWFSVDKYRKLLKFQGNVKIGAIEGELVEYEKGDEKFSMDDLE
ncbi:DUF3108 domain-containing protein [Halobacteriovorax sp. HLS]|uniref:DUF3108 domain-containing protein n=1 Tax=Halobacteriovorax sp. HLS TaxID=2234000 RepID=UPI000FDCCB61|nr:DUF3108 domain-containing protein [Halobacteriovorax sp. HLS]